MNATTWTIRLLTLIVGFAYTAAGHAGAFTFSDNGGVDIDFITHPKNYLGVGGTVTNTVCVNTTVLPAGVTATEVENTVLKVIATWNRLRGVTNNLRAGGNNDIAFAEFDYESVLLHEAGHCIGLAHPNLASESGLSDPQRNATQARLGGDGVFDTNSGTDGLHGSADDLRDDDINRYWFFPSTNDPLAFPSVIDSTTFTVDTASLPGADTYAANADRSVLSALGYTNTESTMQQGQLNDEAQRRPTNEDVSTLMIGMAGLDGTAGNADDYDLVMTYGGQVTTNSCDINVTFNAATSFASCSVGANIFNSGHGRLNSATVQMSPTINWLFSQAFNTSTTIASVTPASPEVGSPATVAVTVARLSGLMTGDPSGTFEVTLSGDTCTGTLSSGSGSCDVTPVATGSQTLSAEYYGFEGFDASSATQSVTVVAASITPTVTITSDTPDPSAVGQAYNVAVTVSGGAGTATGSVTVDDGAANCAITLSSGSGNCNLTSTTPGAKTLTASYGGDGTYSAASDTEAHTVTAVTPTVTITSDTPDPSAVGQAYNVVVTVSGSAGTATGSVTVDDGVANCSITLSGGSGNCNLTSNTVGAKTLTASYGGDANYSAGSDTEAHTVTTAPSIVAITSDAPDPSAVGQAYNVVVTVGGTAGTATGSVTVDDGVANCAISLSSGTGNCNLTSTTAGAKTLTASYGGDANYAAGSDTEAHTVNATAPTVTITSDAPDPSAVGQAYSVVVTVSGSAGTATGSVTVDDGAANCSITLSGGSGNCNLTSNTVGAKTLTASYGGDANYSAGSDTEGHTVTTAPSIVAITSDAPDPSAIGQAYNVVVTVGGTAGTATGSVTVDDGAANCAITLSSGSGNCNLTSTTAGAKTLTASYGGDANYAAGSDTEAHTVTSTVPIVTITSDAPDPSAVGQAYNVVVTVSGSAGTATGSVTVDDGAANCSITLSGGSGNCTLTSTTAGAKTLTASYGGDANYAAGSDTEAHTVTAATPTVAITSDAPDPSAVGQAYSVVVTVSGSAGTATGSVTVDDGAANCSITLSGGSGNCNLTSNTVGAKTLTASYGGDANYSAGSDTEGHTVTTAPSIVAITSDAPDPSAIGQAYNVVVTVGGTAGTATGSVTVDDGAANCAISLSSGTGNCNLTSTTAGAKTLTASYGGDANYAAGSDTETHTVNAAAPTVTITSDAPDPSAVGQAYNVVVTVSGSTGTATGSVTVDDGAANCAITLSGGFGNCNLTSTTAGAKTLTASYGGDANYAAGSDTEAHTVTAATPTVAITSDAPDPSAVGQAYNVVVTVSGSAGTATGSVTVDDGAANCSISLSSGTGNCNLTSTTAGAKTLTASYGGDANYAAGSDTEAHTVTGTSTTPTVTITSDAPDPSAVGQAYNVVVTVSGSLGTATGLITVDDGIASCSTSLSGGSGNCNLTSNTVGAKTLTASYGGDSNYDAGSDTEAHTVTTAPSIVTITSDEPDPSAVGQAYNVVVTAGGTAGTATGSVTVDDGVANCSISLSSGTGNCNLTSTTAGAKTLTANYSGDGNYAVGSDTEGHTVGAATDAVFEDGFEDL